MPATLKRKKQTKSLTEQLEQPVAEVPAVRQEYELAAQAVAEDRELSLAEVTRLKLVLEELDITPQQFDDDVQQLRSLALTEQELAKLDRKALEKACSDATAKWRKTLSRDARIAANKAAAERQVWGAFSIAVQQTKRKFRHLFPVEAR